MKSILFYKNFRFTSTLDKKLKKWARKYMHSGPLYIFLLSDGVELSLAELRSTTGCFETVFLSLFHSRVTS